MFTVCSNAFFNVNAQQNISVCIDFTSLFSSNIKETL